MKSSSILFTVLLIALDEFTHSVQAQGIAAPRLMFKGVEVPEHSLVVREAIGEANTDTLMCVTDYRPCCANDTGSTWIYGNTVSHYMSRGDGVVRLHQTPDAAGIVACRIRITDGDSESAYQLLLVGVYPHTSSISAPEDGTPTVNCTGGSPFTLTSDPEADEPEFVLSCTSSGGPVGEFSCTNGDTGAVATGTARFQDSEENREKANYNLSATVTGNYPGNYVCWAIVNRFDDVGVEPESLTYPEFPGPAQTITVTAVDPPTGLSAVHDITSTQAYSIAVSWTPSLSPPSTIYGYRIYYQLGGAEESVVVTGSDVASYNLTVMYWARHRIRMQTLSESRLPSELTATIHSTVPPVSMAIDYTSPVDFDRVSESDYRAGSGPVTLTCLVEGVTAPTVNYQWSLTCGHSSCTVLTQLTTQSVSWPYLVGVDGGTYTCTVTNYQGNGIGSVSTVVNVIGAGVYVLEGDATNVPINAVTNNSIVISQTNRALHFHFLCCSGSTDTNVSRSQLIGLDGTPLPATSALAGLSTGALNLHVQPSAITVRSRASHEPDLTLGEEGVYTCRMPDENKDLVELSIGIYRSGFNILPTISSLTYDASSASIICTSTGSPPTTVTWTRDGSSLPSGYTTTQMLTGRSTSTYSNVLTVPQGGTAEGTYGCEVENALGTSGLRTVEISLQEVTISSSDSAPDLGSKEFSLTCNAVFLGLVSGIPAIVWTDSAGTLPPADFTVGAVTGSGTTYSRTLMFNTLRASQVGPYSCKVEHDSNEGKATAVVAGKIPSPRVSVTADRDRLLYDGENVTLSCEISLDAAIDVQTLLSLSWHGPSGEAVASATYHTTGELTYHHDLTLTSLNSSDSGDYSCIASAEPYDMSPLVPSEEGFDSYTITVALAPLSPPQNFTVTVDGPNSLRFSWGPPTEDDRVGSITSYWLSCDPQPEGLPRTYQAQDFTRTGGVMAVVSGFTPSTTYNCSVMASNMAGSGPTASATATTPEDLTIFQLQITGVHDCKEWASLNTLEKLEDVHDQLELRIEGVCECGFTAPQHLTSGEFQCLSQRDEVTYRASLRGTNTTSSAVIVADLERWVVSGQATIVIQGLRFSLDRSCRPVGIEAFDDPECEEGPVETPTNTMIIEPIGEQSSDGGSDITGFIGGIAAVIVALVVVTAVSVTVIAVLVLRYKQSGRLDLNQTDHRRGGSVKSREVAKSSFETDECEAYGIEITCRLPSLPPPHPPPPPPSHQNPPEYHDYEPCDTNEYEVPVDAGYPVPTPSKTEYEVPICHKTEYEVPVDAGCPVPTPSKTEYEVPMFDNAAYVPTSTAGDGSVPSREQGADYEPIPGPEP